MEDLNELRLESQDEDADILLQHFSSSFNTKRKREIIYDISHKIDDENQKINSLNTKNPERILPGPAGILQKNQSRSNKRNKFTKINQNENVIDDDFLNGPWINLVNYVELNDLTSKITNVNEIKDVRKIEYMTLIVIDFELNEYGCTIVSFKDESGEIDGLVHKDVFEQYPQLSNQCAIILNNVTYFNYLSDQYYLCIVVENIIKVYEKEERDDEMSSIQNKSILEQKYEKEKNSKLKPEDNIIISHRVSDFVNEINELLYEDE